MFTLLLVLAAPWSSEPRALDPRPFGTQDELEALIEDLRDDDIPWNAFRAKDELRALGHEARPALEAALDSDDAQQRHCAADVLRDLLQSHGLEPSERLLDVTVEGLRDDHLRGATGVENAGRGRWFLAQHMDVARTRLLRVVGTSTDRQQRLFAALLLVDDGAPEGLAGACEVLIEHLRDNNIYEDAVASCRALYALGPIVLPYLEPHRNSSDRQQREATELLILDLTAPPRNHAELLARWELHTLSENFPDPCLAGAYTLLQDLGDPTLGRRFWSAWHGDLFVPSLAALQATHGRRSYLAHKIDFRDAEHLIVAIGFRGPKWDRRLTLRFSRDGTVERRELGYANEIHWFHEAGPRSSVQ